MARRAALNAFPKPEHNHDRCRQAALRRAQRAFKDKGLRLTPLRQLVFEKIADSHHAVGAYEVLERLATAGRRLAPISVYRAIEALRKAGVIHRLESRNAFFACHAAHDDLARRDGGQGGVELVLQCESCGTVAEIVNTGVFKAIAQAARAVSFTRRETIVEVSGLCGHCRVDAAKGRRKPVTPTARRR